MGSIKKVLANLGLACLTVLLTLLLLEGALRFTPYRNLLSFTRSHVPQYYYRTDPVTGYDISENFPKTQVFLDDGVGYPIWSNGIGCFDRPYNGEKDFILLVGDSFTHAFASFEDKWGTLMEANLGTRVLKCGVSGYGTKQASLKADRTCALVGRSPQLIVVGYTMNDFMDDYLFPEYSVVDGYFYITKALRDTNTGEISTRVRRKPPVSPRIWLKRHSILYNLFETFTKRYSRQEERVLWTEAIGGECSDTLKCPHPWLERAWKSHFEEIRNFGKLGHSGNAKVLFVIIPTKEQVYPSPANEKNGDLDRKYAIIPENMKKEGMLYIDLLPLFRKLADRTATRNPSLDLYWAKDGHWNVRGNRLAGLLVSQYILEQNLVEVPDKAAALARIRDGLRAFTGPQGM